MKLRLPMFINLMTNLLASAQTQTSPNDVVFLDEQGRVIPNGTVVVLSRAVTTEFPFEGSEIAGEVFIQNKTDKPQSVSLSYTINEVDEGGVEVCAYENCTTNPDPGAYEVDAKLLSIGLGKETVETEHTYGKRENCTTTLKLKVKELGSGKERGGPSITVKFDTNAAGIVSVVSQKGVTYDVYNTQGVLLHKQLTSLTDLPKGVYIVEQTGVAYTKKYVIR